MLHEHLLQNPGFLRYLHEPELAGSHKVRLSRFFGTGEK